MPDNKVSGSSALLNFAGSLGLILIFVLIIRIAYLPNRPEPIHTETDLKRQNQADKDLAAGLAKISVPEVIDADARKIRIPIRQAMRQVVKDYNNNNNESTSP